MPILATFFDMLLLRKGPEHLPYSWFLLNTTIVVRTGVLLLGAALIEAFDAATVGSELMAWALSLLCFGALLAINGRSARLLQTMTAIVGCGALITLIMTGLFLIVTPLFGEAVAADSAGLLLLWSVVVKGHIMARALDWHWYAGLMVSVAVFALQLSVAWQLTVTH